ncbi:MAG: zinc transporter ZupT [Actinomycetota bacterium]|nr:zinc transporter ZupT [Actinomycetota bacterium]
MSDILKALLLTTGAGLATVIGSLLGLIPKKLGNRFFSFSLGFTAGVMIGISFLELMPSAVEEVGFLKSNLFFFAGFGLMFLIDSLIPHEYIGQKDGIAENTDQKLLRMGLFVALGIGIHNFPEGMATFYSAMVDIRLGIAIAVAIAIHNIPEGLAVSTPIFKATGSKKKAFFWSMLSGIAEPAGALVTAAFLLPLNPQILGMVLAAIAGIMVFISIDELVPVSRSYGFEHMPVLGFIAGMVVMSVSLFLICIDLKCREGSKNL